MDPWFIATEQFNSKDGSRWQKYIEWSGLAQLAEVVSLDPLLCPPILTELKAEYWPHIVNEDFMLDYFVDLEFLQHEIANIAERNLLCVFRNPSSASARPPIDGFEFLGYDLVDIENSASALTNCGGFPGIFANSELSSVGLLANFNRAHEVQQLLRSRHPEEPHANCHLWEIFRSTN